MQKLNLVPKSIAFLVIFFAIEKKSQERGKFFGTWDLSLFSSNSLDTFDDWISELP